MLFKYLAASAVVLAALAQQNTATRPEDLCAVEGTVTNSVTGEPLRKATVILRRMPDGSASSNPPVIHAPFSATTDAAGKYSIDSVAPGKYRMNTERIGFVGQQYGARPGESGQPGTVLTLSPGQKMKGADFPLIPQGVIVGRILDEDGDPLQNVSVNCLRQTYIRGRRQWVPVNGQMSNDLGEYRIHSLAPGRYLISAIYRPAAMERPGVSGNTPQESYAPTYYPGGSAPESAAPVEVTAGAQLRGMDFRLQKTRAVRVRGHIAGLPKKLQRGTSIRLMPRADSMYNFSPRGTRVNDQTGEFTINAVTPGSYWLIAEAVDEGEALAGRIPLEVGSTNIDDATLTLSRPGELTGVVKVLDCDVKPTTLRGQLELQVSGMGYPNFETREDLTFTVKNVWPGAYRVRLSGVPSSCYVKGVRFGDSDVTESGLDLSQGVAAGQLVVTVSGGAAQVEGSVENDKQQAVPSAWVVLVPEGSRKEQPDNYVVATTDQNGKYTAKGVVPGEYRVYAFEQVEPGAYQDREFMKPWESKGEKVTLQENGHETVQLKVINPKS